MPSVQTVGGPSLSASWSHTCSNTDLLVVCVAANTPVTAVTYGGTPLTKAGEHDGADTYAALWYLLNPPDGTATVALTGGSSWYSGSLSISDADTPINANSGGGTSTTPTVNITSETGHLVAGTASGRQASGQTFSAGAGQTLHWSNRNGSAWGMASSEAGASSVVHSYSSDVSREWSIVAFSIPPAPSGTNRRRRAWVSA